MPLTRVSKDAGEYLALLGRLDAALLVLGPAALPARPQGGLRVPAGRAREAARAAGRRGSTSPSTRRSTSPTGTIAFVGGRVVTMNGDEVIEDGVVVVEGNRIKAVGTQGSRRDSRRARRRSTSTGKTVLPGFVDAHSHGGFGARRHHCRSRTGTVDASLAFGVTTVHDPVERHRRGLRGGRARARRPDPRAAHLLDRHDPLRRRRRLQGRDRLARRRASRTCAA